MAVRTPPIIAPSFLSTHPTWNVPEAATQTFKHGALIAIASGYAQELATNGLLVAGIAASLGQNLAAAGVASGANSGITQIIPALPHVQFEFTLDKASTLGAYTSLATDRGSIFGVTKDSNGIWYLDVDKLTTNARFLVTDFRDPVGTVGARVFAVVRPTFSTFGQ